MHSSLLNVRHIQFDVEEPMKREGATIQERVKTEIVDDEKSSLQHHLYSKLSYVNHFDLQERKFPINICIKEEHDCVNQGALDVVSIKKEDKSEGDCCQMNEEQETNELTSELDVENSIFKKFEAEKFESDDTILGENHLGEVKCEVLGNENTIKIEDDDSNETLECGSRDYRTEVVMQQVEMLKCEFCEYSTNYKRNLSQHLKVKHNDENSEMLKCGTCEYMTKRKSNLVRHIKTKHDSNSESFECKFCEYSTKVKNYLTRHLKTLHDEKSELLKCGLCEYTTKFKRYLMEHINTKHEENTEKLRCALCGFTTKLTKYLTRHIKVKHDVNSETYECKFCRYSTKLKGNLSQHIKMKHDKNCEILKCALCEYTTKHKGNLNQHVRIKHDESSEILKCAGCGYTARRKQNLRQHLKRIHGLE